ncbi:MAG: dihydropteroate synthase [Kofleriaceae bacterium]|nr:dihydropteroate synthase [Kofleriaceae bacterium]
MNGELTHRPKTAACYGSDLPDSAACDNAANESVARDDVVSTQASQLTMWRLRSQTLDWSRPYVMGIVNLTPDSFSDGGRVKGVDAALTRAEELLSQGADLIDLGGESTRPGADTLSVEEECLRVLPAIEAIVHTLGASVSVDTTKSEVARRALACGAEIVNDVSGGRFDPKMYEVVESGQGYYVCGHVRGESIEEVHKAVDPSENEVGDELLARLLSMPAWLRPRTMIDPCLGFGKGLQSNLSLLADSGKLSARLSAPVLIGASRKRFVGELCDLAIGDRDAASVGAALAAVRAGAHMLRVHNVKMTVEALRVFCAASTLGKGAHV